MWPIKFGTQENCQQLVRQFGHPSKFQRVSLLGSITARHSSSGRQPNFVALNRKRHLYSAVQPSRWALAHILVSSWFMGGLHACCLWQKICCCYRVYAAQNGWGGRLWWAASDLVSGNHNWNGRWAAVGLQRQAVSPPVREDLPCLRQAICIPQTFSRMDNPDADKPDSDVEPDDPVLVTWSNVEPDDPVAGMSQETHLVSQPAPSKETKKPGWQGQRFATKVEEAEEGYFDFEWRQSRGTGQPIWPQQNRARETVPGGSETFHVRTCIDTITAGSEWVSDLFLNGTSAHLVVPYNGKKVIKMWRYNQGYLATIFVKIQSRLFSYDKCEITKSRVENKKRWWSMLEAWLPSITDDNVSRILLQRNMAATNVMVSHIISK